ncbi:MAG: four helix bundle protein [Terriglobia bacterium]
MDEKTFKARTKQFGLGVIQLVEELPRTRTADVIGKQFLRPATSVGANYRAACRGRSASDLISKLAIVEEEGDQSIYWLELLIESGIIDSKKAAPLLKEANELVAMPVASIKTLRNRTTAAAAQAANSANTSPKSKI